MELSEERKKLIRLDERKRKLLLSLVITQWVGTGLSFIALILRFCNL